MKLNSYSEKFKEVKIAEGIFFEDERGFLKKTMFGDELSNTMESIKEVICSSSNKDVVRGLHFQKKNDSWRLSIRSQKVYHFRKT